MLVESHIINSCWLLNRPRSGSNRNEEEGFGECTIRFGSRHSQNPFRSSKCCEGKRGREWGTEYDETAPQAGTHGEWSPSLSSITLDLLPLCYCMASSILCFSSILTCVIVPLFPSITITQVSSRSLADRSVALPTSSTPLLAHPSSSRSMNTFAMARPGSRRNPVTRTQSHLLVSLYPYRFHSHKDYSPILSI